MTVVYLDSVFLFNALLDYLLFLSTARLAGIPLRRRRYLLCGVLGGLYAAAVFLPGGGFLTETLVKAGVGLLLALIAFGRETHFLRLTLLTVAIACALAGTVLALGLLAGQHIPNARGIFYTNVNGKTLLLSASGVYLLLTVIFRAAAAHGIRGECLPVTVCLLGQTVALTALLDTGNSLRDTAGEPVLTAELSRFPQLAAAIQHRPPAETLPMLRQRFPKLRPQLLPMRTAAGGVGCQLDVLIRPIGAHGLDETDGADGNEILDVDARILEPAGDVHHQTQVMLDQLLSGGLLSQSVQQLRLSLPAQRRWKRIAAADIMQLRLPAQSQTAQQPPQPFSHDSFSLPRPIKRYIRPPTPYPSGRSANLDNERRQSPSNRCSR